MSTNKIPQVTLDVQTDRPLIPAGETCQRYAVLTLRIPEKQPETERLPLNLSLIIDRSGSMRGEKLEYVKEAAIHVLRMLTTADRVSVVIYDDEIEVLAPSSAVTPEAREALITRIRAIKPGGMTNLSGAWFTGCDQIADYMTTDYVNRALLLTDGLANRGLTDHEQLVYQAKELRRRGITTTTFGVGDDFNQFLLQGIADGGGGHFYFIGMPKQIPAYFQSELGELLDTVVREMTLDISLPSGGEINILNDVPNDLSERRQRLLLGDAYAGETRKLALKLQLSGQPLGQSVSLPLALHYEAAQNHQAISLDNQAIVFTAADAQACATQPVNEAVLSEAGRLEVEQAKMTALEKEYQGDIIGAQEALRRAGVAVAQTMPAPMVASFQAELSELDQAVVKQLTATEQKSRHFQSYQRQRSRKKVK